MQPISTRHILVDGCRIAFGTIGEGEPVVLVHGTPATSLLWRSVARLIANQGFEVRFFDLLGYGESERPWDETVDTSASGQVPVLIGLLDAWGIEKAHLVGHDIGGAIGQRMGVFHRDRLRLLTMINAVCFDASPSERTKQQMAPGLDKMLNASDAEHRSVYREWLLSAVKNRDAFTHEALPAYLDYISGPIGQASYFQHQMRHYSAHHTMEVADRLGELAGPATQVIWGADDAWLKKEWAERLASAIPGSELHLVKDAAHFAMEDQPAEIANRIADFLARVGR